MQPFKNIFMLNAQIFKIPKEKSQVQKRCTINSDLEIKEPIACIFTCMCPQVSKIHKKWIGVVFLGGWDWGLGVGRMKATWTIYFSPFSTAYIVCLKNVLLLILFFKNIMFSNGKVARKRSNNSKNNYLVHSSQPMTLLKVLPLSILEWVESVLFPFYRQGNWSSTK